jgi:hypothetical protein
VTLGHLGADVRAEHTQGGGAVIFQDQSGEASEALNVVDGDRGQRHAVDEVEQVSDLLLVFDRIVGQSNDLGVVASGGSRGGSGSGRCRGEEVSKHLTATVSMSAFLLFFIASSLGPDEVKRTCAEITYLADRR